MTFEKPWPEDKVFDLVDNRVMGIIEACKANEYEVYLTGDGNFRFDVATIAPYKGKRSGDKPYHWKTVGERLKSHWGAITVLGIEADDILAMRGTKLPEYAIASRDKDLRQVPCHHYSWGCGEHQPERPLYEVDYLGQVDYEVKVSPKGDKSYKLVGHGLRFFYGQILTGDTIDNIKGCPKIGPKTAADELKFLTTEQELLNAVSRKYQLAYGDDWKKYLEENARLLYLIRDYDWVTEEHLGDNCIKYSINRMWEIPNAESTDDSTREDCRS